jgi:hypothetical protein
MSDFHAPPTFDEALGVAEAGLDGISAVDPRPYEQADRVIRRGVEERLGEHRRQQLALQRPLISALANLLLADLLRNPVAEQAQ